MDIFLYGMGIISCVITFLAMTITGTSIIYSYISDWWETKQYEIQQIGFDRKCNHLLNDSYWFSEDLATYNLIRNLATSRNTWNIREQWRNERKIKEQNVPN